MSDKSSNLIYSVDERPPLNKLIILGLQYVMLMSIYLIIILVYFTIAKAPPEIIPSAISMGMIALAISTIITSD